MGKLDPATALNLLRFSLFFLAWIFGPAAMGAEGLAVRLIVSEDNAFAIQTAARLEALLKQADAAVLLEEAGTSIPQGFRRLWVTVGSRAWRGLGDGGGEAPVLAVGLPRTGYEDRLRTMAPPSSAVFLDMPPGRIFNLIQAAMPRRTAVGMAASVGTVLGPQSRGQLPRMENSATERGLRLLTEKIERENEVGPAVERLVQQSSVFLAIPDALVHSATTVPPLLLLTYRANVPVVGYSESYLKAGAVLALYATPEQIAQQAFEVVMSYRQGKPLPPPQGPKYFRVGSNETVARSLGLSLPAAAELEERLRHMRE